MKNILLSFICIFGLIGLVSCINSSTSFSNRGVTHISTPENIGAHSYTQASPTSSDSNVSAAKTLDTDTKSNVSTGTLSDNSSNVQNTTNSVPEEEKKEEEVPVNETEALPETLPETAPEETPAE